MLAHKGFLPPTVSYLYYMLGFEVKMFYFYQRCVKKSVGSFYAELKILKFPSFEENFRKCFVFCRVPICEEGGSWRDLSGVHFLCVNKNLANGSRVFKLFDEFFRNIGRIVALKIYIHCFKDRSSRLKGATIEPERYSIRNHSISKKI